MSHSSKLYKEQESGDPSFPGIVFRTSVVELRGLACSRAARLALERERRVGLPTSVRTLSQEKQDRAMLILGGD